MKQTQKDVWQSQWHQALGFAGPYVAQLRWIAIQRGGVQRLLVKLSQQSPRQRRVLQQAFAVYQPLAIDPDAVHPQRIGIEPGSATGQIEYAFFGAAAHGRRIE